MQDYDGNEMEIRTTNHGKYQVLPVPHTTADMTRAPVFTSREEAEAYIARPMPVWMAAEREKARASEPYVERYAAVLAQPEFRERRRQIQELYGEAAEESKRAATYQRAAIYGFGQTSCIGRDVGQVRQGVADEMADDAGEAWKAWSRASREYEIAIQAAMRAAGIPEGMFRQAKREATND